MAGEEPACIAPGGAESRRGTRNLCPVGCIDVGEVPPCCSNFLIRGVEETCRRWNAQYSKALPDVMARETPSVVTLANAEFIRRTTCLRSIRKIGVVKAPTSASSINMGCIEKLNLGRVVGIHSCCLSEPIFKQYGCLEKRAIVPQKCFATGPASFSAVPIVPLLVPDHVSIDDALKRSILRRDGSILRIDPPGFSVGRRSAHFPRRDPAFRRRGLRAKSFHCASKCSVSIVDKGCSLPGRDAVVPACNFGSRDARVEAKHPVEIAGRNAL